MKIKIYAIGHLKEPYLKQGINEYLERLKASIDNNGLIVGFVCEIS